MSSWVTRRLRRSAGHRADAEGLLFRGLRLRLTLWYGGVLAASLLLAGIGLYLVLQYLLMQPITNDFSRQIDLIAQQWIRDPGRACAATGRPASFRG